MSPDYVEAFILELRRRAEDPVFGASAEARVCERLAVELEERRLAWEMTEVSLVEAHEISGVSVSQLRRLRDSGVITLRRRDLPRKPGHGVQRGPRRPDEPRTLVDDVLAARRRRTG